jgi:MFS family permease
MLVQFRKRHVQRELVVAFALLFNTFSWYNLGQSTIGKISYAFAEGSLEKLYIGLAYPFSIILSAVAGAVLFTRARKPSFTAGWILLGIAASIFSAIPAGASLPLMLVATCWLGASAGFGMPLCLSYFTRSTSIENRGKLGGITLFATLFTAALILTFMSSLDLGLNAVVLAAWRAWSLPFSFLVSKEQTFPESDSKRTSSVLSILRDRTFYLYFIAWTMFAFVNSFESVVVNVAIGEFRFFVKIVEPAVAGFSALFAGLLSDWVGRKRVLIFGFVSLGIAYSIIGLFPQLWISWTLYFVLDGMALGSLWVLFVVVLWGDLSRNGTEKLYAIGETPFFLTQVFYLLLTPYLALLPQSSSFSLAAFFLFLAVLPLVFAPETLPEKKLKERELKGYIEKAKKIKEKRG